MKMSQKFHWGDTQFNLLGINFPNDMSELPRLNYVNALGKAEQIMNSWQYRYLTPIGKITIIKTLIVSIFTHLFMVIPTPIETINELNKLLFNFLWDEKPDKISRDRACTTQLNGGLKMINIHKFEMSMKIRWVKQIFIGSKKGWFNLLLHDTDLSYLPTLGSQW